jgi:preprotein translocase subunit SecA
MDPNWDKIYTPEQIDGMRKAMVDSQLENSLLGRLVEMKVDPTKKQMARKPPKVGRNEPCPCGSGKKFKKCHLRKEE